VITITGGCEHSATHPVDVALVMRTKKSVLVAAVVACGLAMAVPARADVFQFSYTDNVLSASGTLTTGSAATGLNGPGFNIIGIDGTVTDPSGTSSITSLLGLAVCCRSPANNNVFYSGEPHLDVAGLGFADSNGEQVNLFFEDQYFALVSLDNNITWDLSGPGTFAVSGADPFTVVTPLPTALPLFATGLGALGLLGWYRKRKTPSCRSYH